MLNFNSVLLFSENPKELAGFYQKVLGKDPEMADPSGYYGFLAGTAFLTIGPHDKVHGKNQSPERLLVNFETKDVKGDFERIKALGATVIAKPYLPEGAKGDGIATFADPDGNYFQLMPPWQDMQNSNGAA
jgi:predicted enzyme related to lactoylglutathione lyase